MSDDYSYRGLILWDKAQALTMQIIQLVADLPTDKVAPLLGRQIIRSASSIGANIAEGHGRYSPGAHRNHLSIAKGSACETDGWLDLLRRARYLTADREAELHAQCLELIRMLTAKILDLERRETTKRSRVREETAPYEVEGDEL